MSETTLNAWLSRAWDEHAQAAPRIVDELIVRAPTLPDDADGAEAVRLAEHVALGHLADAAGLRRFLAALPAHAALAAGVQRAQWALAALAGIAEPPLPEGARWRALQNVVLAEIARGQLARARERLLAEEDAAAASSDADARKGYAATANNVALDLRTATRGDTARDALMIDAAELSRRAWERAGNWINIERADYQLALCHAVLGQGPQALRYAQACLARCEAEGADAAERFFAHECCVHAQRAAGDAGQAVLHHERMAAMLAEIGDDGMRQWCAQTLAQLQ